METRLFNKMSYTFLKPKNTNILGDTWNIVKTKWFFWLPLPLAFIFGPVIIIPIVYFIIILNKIKMSFWKEFAEMNGWHYKDTVSFNLFSQTSVDLNQELGIMFKQGHSRNIYNQIEGEINDRTFRMFGYNFSVGSGKNTSTYYYTVFTFKFNGLFPHLYLNSRDNSWSISTGEKIPLPREFENKFSLMAPKEYEIEALEIFTPDILVKLLDNSFPYDVEFVNQEILVFVDGQIDDFSELEKSFNKALELRDLFSEKLDRFKFQQIGDMPSVLK